MKHLFSILTTLFLVLVFFVSCGGSEPETGGIYGYVTDFDNGAAIPNVEIRLVPGEQAALTDYDGMFEFNDLEPGQYTIFASKVEYLTNRVDITVEDKKVRRDIVIRKRD